MLTENRMCSVLIVSGGKKGVDFLRRLLPATDFSPVTAAGSAAEAKQLMIAQNFDIVIINAPLPDEAGHSFAVTITDRDCEILLLVKNENFDEISYLVGEYGIFTLSKPITGQIFSQAIYFLLKSRRKLQTLTAENQKLHAKMEDLRIIDRAKCVLISQMKMTEEQAHKYIERQAMDLRSSKRSVAEGILRMQ